MMNPQAWKKLSLQRGHGMCFSATVSFTASTVLLGIGILNFTQVRSKKTILLASFPLLFSVQQLSEGLIWLNMTNWKNPSVEIFLSYFFLVIAYCIWPILTPLASYFIEPNATKRKIMLGFSVVGFFIAAWLLFILLSSQIATRILEHSLNYELVSSSLTPFSRYVLSLLYLFPVGLVWLVSSHVILKWAGALLFFSAIISWAVAATCYTSVWCFFGALISILTYFCLKQIRRV